MPLLRASLLPHGSFRPADRERPSEQEGDIDMTDTTSAETPAPSASGTALCEMRDIKVAFGGLHAVDGVTIDLFPGEVVALVGGNGAGKSTLVHTLSGAHPADSGIILINGQPVVINNPRDARATESRSSTKSWPWPTTSMPPATSFSAASWSRRRVRSTTRRWTRRRGT